MTAQGSLLAVSDIHVGYRENARIVEALRPTSDDDWLLVAGDVAEKVADIEWALALLAGRFAKVIWAPGNHELWTTPEDPVQARGHERYLHLVEMCRRIGVVTPEDPYPIWRGHGGPATVAPLFLLYDYTFRINSDDTFEQALAGAHEAGVVCVDEYVLHPDPYPSRAQWCQERVAETARRLEERDPELPTVLVTHWPLVREPTRILHHPEFALWCGTELTADWPVRFGAAACVYGHLHIPRTTHHDGIRFEEVSLGYPREWRPRTRTLPWPRRVFP